MSFILFVFFLCVPCVLCGEKVFFEFLLTFVALASRRQSWGRPRPRQ